MTAARSATDAREAYPTEIQVLMANLPAVLEQVLAEVIHRQPDMHLVGRVHGRVKVLQSVDDRVDVLILGSRNVEHLPGYCTHLLVEFPALKVLVLTLNGDAVLLYWLGLRRRRLRPPSPDTLPSYIRRAWNVNPAE